MNRVWNFACILFIAVVCMATTCVEAEPWGSSWVGEGKKDLPEYNGEEYGDSFRSVENLCKSFKNRCFGLNQSREDQMKKLMPFQIGNATNMFSIIQVQTLEFSGSLFDGMKVVEGSLEPLYFGMESTKSNPTWYAKEAYFRFINIADIGAFFDGESFPHLESLTLWVSIPESGVNTIFRENTFGRLKSLKNLTMRWDYYGDRKGMYEVSEYISVQQNSLFEFPNFLKPLSVIERIKLLMRPANLSHWEMDTLPKTIKFIEFAVGVPPLPAKSGPPRRFLRDSPNLMLFRLNPLWCGNEKQPYDYRVELCKSLKGIPRLNGGAPFISNSNASSLFFHLQSGCKASKKLVMELSKCPYLLHDVASDVETLRFGLGNFPLNDNLAIQIRKTKYKGSLVLRNMLWAISETDVVSFGTPYELYLIIRHIHEGTRRPMSVSLQSMAESCCVNSCGVIDLRGPTLEHPLRVSLEHNLKTNKIAQGKERGIDQLLLKWCTITDSFYSIINEKLVRRRLEFYYVKGLNVQRLLTTSMDTLEYFAIYGHPGDKYPPLRFENCISSKMSRMELRGIGLEHVDSITSLCMPKLQWLDFSDNSISGVLYFSSTTFPFLRIVDYSGNNITSLEFANGDPLPNCLAKEKDKDPFCKGLCRLSISNNRIDKLHFTWSKVFEITRCFENEQLTLTMQYNMVPNFGIYIEEGVTDHPYDTSYLGANVDLSNNILHTLRKYSFVNLTVVETLSLKNSSVKIAEGGFIAGRSCIIRGCKIDLSDNHLDGDALNTFFVEQTRSSQTPVTEWNLANNGLTSVPKGLVAGLHILKNIQIQDRKRINDGKLSDKFLTIDLSNNNISHLNSSLCDGVSGELLAQDIPHAIYFDLSNNNLQMISEDAFYCGQLRFMLILDNNPQLERLPALSKPSSIMYLSALNTRIAQFPNGFAWNGREQTIAGLRFVSFDGPLFSNGSTWPCEDIFVLRFQVRYLLRFKDYLRSAALQSQGFIAYLTSLRLADVSKDLTDGTNTCLYRGKLYLNTEFAKLKDSALVVESKSTSGNMYFFMWVAFCLGMYLAVSLFVCINAQSSSFAFSECNIFDVGYSWSFARSYENPSEPASYQSFPESVYKEFPKTNTSCSVDYSNHSAYGSDNEQVFRSPNR
eukprot:Nk52_evm77s745 gene=Nk52_evmTU77s745